MEKELAQSDILSKRKYHQKIPYSQKVTFDSTATLIFDSTMGKSIFSNANPGAWKLFLRFGNNFYGKSRPKRSKLCYRRDDWSTFDINDPPYCPMSINVLTSPSEAEWKAVTAVRSLEGFSRLKRWGDCAPAPLMNRFHWSAAISRRNRSPLFRWLRIFTSFLIGN